MSREGGRPERERDRSLLTLIPFLRDCQLLHSREREETDNTELSRRRRERELVVQVKEKKEKLCWGRVPVNRIIRKRLIFDPTDFL